MRSSDSIIVDDEIGIRDLLSEILQDEALSGRIGGKRRRGAQAAPSGTTGDGVARYLDARLRRHHQFEGVGEKSAAQYAGGDDEPACKHRYRRRQRPKSARSTF